MIINLKYSFLLLLVLLFSSCSGVQMRDAQEISSAQIADNFMRLFPDTIAYKNEAKSYKWNYEQGLICEAFYQIWKHTGDQKYFDYFKKNIDYYIGSDGKINTYKLSDFNIDNVAPGKALLRLFSELKEAKYKKAADTLRRQLTLHPRTNEGGFWHKKIYPYQMWLDGLYMAEPFYTMYAQMFNESNSFDDIANQFILIERHLRDESTGLYYHGWDETKQQKWANPTTGRSPNYWGRSVGWFMMALVDVLEIISKWIIRKEMILLRLLVDFLGSVIEFRDKKTKLWYQVIDKAKLDGNYIESSATLCSFIVLQKVLIKDILSKSIIFSIAKESL